MDSWQPIRVTIYMDDPEIDAIGVFDAYTRGDLWNGFVTPYFTKDEGDRVSAWTRAMQLKFPPDAVDTVHWDEALSAFVINDSQYPREANSPVDDEDIVPGVHSDEFPEPLFPIGAYRWTWESAEPSAPR